jgi:hypothetical protein
MSNCPVTIVRYRCDCCDGVEYHDIPSLYREPPKVYGAGRPWSGRVADSYSPSHDYVHDIASRVDFWLDVARYYSFTGGFLLFVVAYAAEATGLLVAGLGGMALGLGLTFLRCR